MEPTAGMKRKASESASQSAKKPRTEPTPPASRAASEGPEHDDYNPADESEDESETDDIACSTQRDDETPLTPGSPRKKFPSEMKTLKCTYEGCTKTFNRPARLEDHLRSHTNERPFACDWDGCDMTYMQKKHLQHHIKSVHTKERNYKCHWEGCEQSFLTGQRLNRHLLVHQGQEQHRCSTCGESFRKKQTLERHIRTEHLKLLPYLCDHVDSQTGVACGQSFKSPAALRRHRDEHSEPEKAFVCEACQATVDEDGNTPKFSFSTKALLTAHIKNEHCQCMFCDVKCSSQQALRIHIETIHSGATLQERKNVPCPYAGCGRSFTKKSNLTSHIKSVHQGHSFVCGSVDLRSSKGAGDWDGQDACGRGFSSKANLVDHVRTQHMGLPSIINARRPKVEKAKKVKAEPSTIDDLTGRTYAELDGRDIDCAVSGCPYKFKREYDRNAHLKSFHHMTEGMIGNLVGGHGAASAGEMHQQGHGNPYQFLGFQDPFDPTPQSGMSQFDHASDRAAQSGFMVGDANMGGFAMPEDYPIIPPGTPGFDNPSYGSPWPF